MRFKDKNKDTPAFFEIKKYMSEIEINNLYFQMSNYRNLILRNTNKLNAILANLNNYDLLTYFQSTKFLNSKYNLNFLEKNIGLFSLIIKLQKSNNPTHLNLLNKMIERHEIHNKNFYCIYAPYPEKWKINSRSESKIIENSVNNIFAEKLGINTIADVKKNIKNKFEIDISCVSDCLVKTNTAMTNILINKSGNFHSRLIIPII
jgi:hypothetical protein